MKFSDCSVTDVGPRLLLFVLFLLLLWVLPIQTAAEDTTAETQIQARFLMTRGKQLAQWGQLIDASSKLSKALAHFEALGDDGAIAESLFWLAFVDERRGRRGDAIAKYRRSLAPLERVDDVFGLWWSQFSIAQLRKTRPGDDTSAEFERVLAILPRIEDTKGVFDSERIQWLLEAGREEGGSLQEIETLRKPEARGKVRRMAEAVTRLLYATYLTEKDAFADAEGQLQLAIAASTGADSFLLPMVLMQMATVQGLAGNDDASLKYAEQALADTSDALPSDLRVRLLKLRAKELLRGGDVQEARQDLLEALHLATDAGLLEAQAEAHMGLATWGFATGAYGEALSHAEQAVTEFEASGNVTGQERGLTLLGVLYARLSSGNRSVSRQGAELAAKEDGDWQEVLEFIEGIHQLPQQEGDLEGLGGLRELLNELQSNLQARDSTLIRDNSKPFAAFSAVATALQYPDDLDRSLKALEGARDFPIPGAIDLQKGLLYKRHRKLEEARKHLVVAYSTFADTGRRDQQAAAAYALGAVYWWAGMPDQALKASRGAVTLAESSGVDVTSKDPWTVFLDTRYQDYVSQLVQVHALRDEPSEAWSVAEGAKAQTLMRFLAGQRVDVDEARDTALAREVQNQKERLRNAETALREARLEEVAARQTSLLEQRQLYLDLQMRLRASTPLADHLVRWDAVDPFTVRRQIVIDPKVSLISYFVTPDEVWIWVLDRKRFEMVRVPIPRQDLARRVRCFVQLLASRGGSIPLMIPRSRGAEPVSISGCSEDTVESLFSLLVEPALPYLEHERWVIVPHGVLHAVPFAALRNPNTQRYILEDHVLSYAPSVQSLAFLQWKEPAPRREALIVGNPATYLPSLPGAEQEARAVADLFGASPLVGVAASEERVRRWLENSGLLHLAVHGVFVRENAYFSRLALADTHAFDGNLEVHEILDELELQDGTWVVLSGCQTALGELTKGDEAVGLSRAFLYAGSPVVVSTLWSIEDASSARLMKTFYKELLAGEQVAVALRRAQLTLLAQPELEDPYYWAAFVAQGDARRRWVDYEDWTKVALEP